MTGIRRRVAIMLDLAWPFKRHAAIFAGVQQYATAHSWHSIIDEFAHNTLLNVNKRAIPYDGIIARVNRPLEKQTNRLGLPLVNVWASSPARNLVAGIYPDSEEIGRTCVDHLLTRGFYNLATLTSTNNDIERRAVAEIVRSAHRAGYSVIRATIPQNPERDLQTWRNTEAIIEKSMNSWKPPVGLYVGQETVGRLVVQMCQARGWKVPQDIAIIAGQNQETLCEHPQPSLTSVELGFERIGYEAARMLDGLMGSGRQSIEQILIPIQGLVVRESTDFQAVADPTVAEALAYISKNSHRNIGANDVARAAGMELRTLQNYFRKILDRPIATEIRRVRIERAKRELVQSKKSLGDISRDVGFGNIQRFYEIFLREVGESPSAYRTERINRSHSDDD